MSENGASGADFMHTDNVFAKYSTETGGEHLLRQVRWIESLPKSARECFPGIIAYVWNKKMTAVYYEKLIMEDALSIIKKENRFLEIKNMFNKAFGELINKVYIEKGNTNNKYLSILLEQVDFRVSSIFGKGHSDLESILRNEWLIVNGSKVRGYKKIICELDKYRNEIEEISTDKLTLIHGDLHSGNIMASSDKIKFVDPRGYFGRDMDAFDIAYDGGKLLHDFHGKYNIARMGFFELEKLKDDEYFFKIKRNPNWFVYENLMEIFIKEWANQISRRFHDRYYLKRSFLYEGLQLLSLLPFHLNNGKVSIVFALSGLVALNRWIAYFKDTDSLTHYCRPLDE